MAYPNDYPSSGAYPPSSAVFPELHGTIPEMEATLADLRESRIEAEMEVNNLIAEQKKATDWLIQVQQKCSYLTGLLRR